MDHSWKRPKIKIPKTKSEWVWDIIGYSFYVGSMILLMVVWSRLPEQIPGHYNAVGEVDRWGAKWELLILPILGAFIGLLLQILERFPETHNYPKRLNENNAEQFYMNSRKMLNQVKNICLLIFALVLFESISVSMEWGMRLGKALLPAILIGTFVPIIIGVIKQQKIK